MNQKKVKRKRASFISPLISITLVLFLIGMFGILVFYADQLKTFFKENLQVNVFFTEDAKEADIFRLKQMLDNEYYIKHTEYIDKETAKQIMIDEIGEDAEEILGFNPFPSSLDIFFHSDYAQVDSIEIFKVEMQKFPFVKEVAYQQVILERIDYYVKIGGLIILSLMVVFMLIAMVLINNTVRLTLFSKRFLIKSMQLVGATQGFIRSPFILKSMTFGLIGGIIAVLMLSLLIYLLSSRIPYAVLGNPFTNMTLALSLPILGVIITLVSSYYSVRKYLKTKLEDLY